MAENMDDAIKRMMAEDELDAAQAGLSKMTVIEWARARSLQPQIVYYWVRTGKIKQELCVCGRKVIDVAGADAYYAEKQETDKKKAGGVTP